MKLPLLNPVGTPKAADINDRLTLIARAVKGLGSPLWDNVTGANKPQNYATRNKLWIRPTDPALDGEIVMNGDMWVNTTDPQMAVEFKRINGVWIKTGTVGAKLGANLYDEYGNLIEGVHVLNSVVDARITTEVKTLRDADAALATRIDTVTASVNQNTAKIATESTTRADAVSALSTRIDSIVAMAGGGTAAVDAEATARINADAALAGRIDNISARLNTGGDVKTSIDAAYQKAVAAESLASGKASASSVTRLEAKVAQGKSGNLLVNADFKSMSGSSPSGWWTAQDLTHMVFAKNLDPAWQVFPTTNADTAFLRQNGSGGNWGFVAQEVAVEGGKTCCASVYSGVHRCSGYLSVLFYNVNGDFISRVDANIADGAASGGKHLSGYVRLKATAVIPANAVRARVEIGKGNTLYGGDSYHFFTRPQFEVLPTGATEPTEWGNGPSDLSTSATKAELSSQITRIDSVVSDVAGKASASSVANLEATINGKLDAKASVTQLNSAIAEVEGRAAATSQNQVNAAVADKATKAELTAQVTRIDNVVTDVAGKASASSVSNLAAKVGQGTANNLVADPFYEDLSWWNCEGIEVEAQSTSDGVGTPRRLVLRPGTFNEFLSDMFVVEVGARYRLSVAVWGGGPAVGGLHIGLHIPGISYVSFHNAAHDEWCTTGLRDFQQFNCEYTVPAGMIGGKANIRVKHALTSGAYVIGLIKVEKMTTAETLADGSVSTQKLSSEVSAQISRVDTIATELGTKASATSLANLEAAVNGQLDTKASVTQLNSAIADVEGRASATSQTQVTARFNATRKEIDVWPSGLGNEPTHTHFYPVYIELNGIAAGVLDIVIERDEVHRNALNLGSYSCAIRCRPSVGGHASGVVYSVEQTTGYGTYNWGVGKVEPNLTNQGILVWLRGGMTHIVKVLTPNVTFTVHHAGYTSGTSSNNGYTFVSSGGTSFHMFHQPESPLLPYLNKKLLPQGQIEKGSVESLTTIEATATQALSVGNGINNKLTATWQVQLDVAGRVSGLKAFNDGAASLFKISADETIIDGSLSASKFYAPSLKTLDANIGRARNDSASNFIDFNAVGSASFLKVGANVDIKADGSGYFRRGIVSEPELIYQTASAVYTGSITFSSSDIVQTAPFRLILGNHPAFDAINYTNSQNYAIKAWCEGALSRGGAYAGADLDYPIVTISKVANGGIFHGIAMRYGSGVGGNDNLLIKLAIYKI